MQALVVVEALALSFEKLVIELCFGIVHSVKNPSVAHLHAAIDGPVDQLLVLNKKVVLFTAKLTQLSLPTPYLRLGR